MDAPAHHGSGHGSTPGTSNRVSCLACRQRKVKCIEQPGQERCAQCCRHDLTCEYREHRRGRKLGEKSASLKRQPESNGLATSQLGLKTETSPNAFASTSAAALVAASVAPSTSLPGVSASHQRSLFSVPPNTTAQHSLHATSHHLHDTSESSAPLHLLATASQELSAKGAHSVAVSIDSSFKAHPGYDELPGLSPIFASKPDIFDDFDPINRRLLSVSEAHILLNFFHDHLSRGIGIFDRILHTVNFLRGRSTMLFTSVLFVAARHFDEGHGVLNPALLTDQLRDLLLDELYPKVLCGNYRSVEIAGAFIAVSPYLPFGKPTSFDHGWTLWGHAIRIAIEIGLNQLGSRKLSANPRLIRNAERLWLTIFIADRSWSAQTGRAPFIPEDELTLAANVWYRDPIADPDDYSIAALAAMRRCLATACELKRYSKATGDLFFANEIRRWRFEYLDNELSKASFRVGTAGQVYFYYARLLYLNSQPSNPADPVIEASLSTESTALVEETLKISESDLRFAHNNLWTMILYGCLFVVKSLSSVPEDVRSHRLGLLNTLTDRLWAAGSIPAHRQGAAATHASNLKWLVMSWQAAHDAESSKHNSSHNNTADLPMSAATSHADHLSLNMPISAGFAGTSDSVPMEPFDPVTTFGSMIDVSQFSTDLASWGNTGTDSLDDLFK